MWTIPKPPFPRLKLKTDSPIVLQIRTMRFRVARGNRISIINLVCGVVSVKTDPHLDTQNDRRLKGDPQQMSLFSLFKCGQSGHNHTTTLKPPKTVDRGPEA